MTRQEYVGLYYRYYHMPTDELQKNVVELHDKKFYEHDIEVYTEHRIAARVLTERHRTGDTLIFHLSKFVK